MWAGFCTCYIPNLCRKVGIQDGELQWFRNYLTDRKQRVTVGNATSSCHAVGRVLLLGPWNVTGPHLCQ